MQAEQLRSIPRPVPEILAFQHEALLRRFRLDSGASPVTAERTFNALKEFMIVCAVKPGLKVTSDPIDQMWHCFLLFSKDYRNFCADYLGRPIDHAPFENASPSTYLETRAFAEEYFGHIDDSLWPAQSKADCSSGCEG
jgi:hypothetical protein